MYRSFASRIIPYDKIAQEAVGAFRKARLKAKERDFFQDDWLYRKGGIVLLGTERGRLVALTTRFYADIRYPSPKLIKDGWGAAEIGAQYLMVDSNRIGCIGGSQCSNPEYRLRRYKKGREAPQFSDEPTVEYRVFGDHDIALLYFSKRDNPFRKNDTLGIRNPTRAIQRTLRESSNLYGFEMVMVSKQSLAELRQNIKVESAAGPMLKVAISIAAGPIIGAVAGQLTGLSDELLKKATSKVTDAVGRAGAEMLEPMLTPMLDDLEHGGRKRFDTPAEQLSHVTPKAMPTVVYDTRIELSGNRVVVPRKTKAPLELDLLGVRIDEAAQEELKGYLESALRRGQVVVSSNDWGTPAGSVVLLPEDDIVLNVELLRHGFAKLDSKDRETLRAFPLLVEAAWLALDNRTGLARDWVEDEEYVASVDALR